MFHRAAGASSDTSQSSTTQLILKYTWQIPLVVLCSMSRFQSLAILRLKVCHRVLLDYPMDDKHLFFLRNGGLFHYFVADVSLLPNHSTCQLLWMLAVVANLQAHQVPIGVISVALIYSVGDDGTTAVRPSTACGGHTIAEAWAMVWCKIALVIWGALR